MKLYYLAIAADPPQITSKLKGLKQHCLLTILRADNLRRAQLGWHVPVCVDGFYSCACSPWLEASWLRRALLTDPRPWLCWLEQMGNLSHLSPSAESECCNAIIEHHFCHILLAKTSHKASLDIKGQVVKIWLPPFIFQIWPYCFNYNLLQSCSSWLVSLKLWLSLIVKHNILNSILNYVYTCRKVAKTIPIPSK